MTVKQYGSWSREQQSIREILCDILIDWPEHILNSKPFSAKIDYVRRPPEPEDPLLGFTAIKVTITDGGGFE